MSDLASVAATVPLPLVFATTRTARRLSPLLPRLRVNRDGVGLVTITSAFEKGCDEHWDYGQNSKINRTALTVHQEYVSDA